jgi:hypothetical protein
MFLINSAFVGKIFLYLSKCTVKQQLKSFSEMFYPEKKELPVLSPTHFLINRTAATVQRPNSFASEVQSCLGRKPTQCKNDRHVRQKELQMIYQNRCYSNYI